jgi:hypothetical protein
MGRRAQAYPRTGSRTVMSSSAPPAASPPSPGARVVEAALAKLGFAKIPAVAPAQPAPEFWVREAGVPRRAFPVYIDPPSGTDPGQGWLKAVAGREGLRSPSRAILVVASDGLAEGTWGRIGGPIDSELAILVVPRESAAEPPHWYKRKVPRGALLRLATGVVVGLYRRATGAEGGFPLDVSEMLEILKERFGVDVAGSLGVESDEDALFLLYQLALRDAYAPGDPGANLHMLVLKPTGPAARLPWFAA